MNSKAGEGVKLSVNDFIIRASALALRKMPEVNAGWAGDRIVQAIAMPLLRMQFVQVDALETSERGENGFGSTGV